jgi:hypothetical protein
MNTHSFKWRKPEGLHDQLLCEWQGLIMWAGKDGTWNVVKPGRGDFEPGTVLVSNEDQAKGKNMKDAQQRAQAAAMVQLQLRLQQPLNR